jgi:hypothetical protein
MQSLLEERVGRWLRSQSIAPERAPAALALRMRFQDHPSACRPGASAADIDAWERRHGYALPSGLRAWLLLSNGFYLDGPVIHPLPAIGPMVPFARMPQLVVQPESWFELGNPNRETVCLDLGYRWPGGGNAVFTSGDDQARSNPRVIASSFDEWFLGLLAEGGREYWFDPDFRDLGDPWEEHRKHVPIPPLPANLRPLAPRVLRLMRHGVDDRAVADTLGITRLEVETLFRHLQHGANGVAG